MSNHDEIVKRSQELAKRGQERLISTSHTPAGMATAGMATPGQSSAPQPPAPPAEMAPPTGAGKNRRLTVEMSASNHTKAKMAAAMADVSLGEATNWLVAAWANNGGTFPNLHIINVVGKVCAGSGFGIVHIKGRQAVIEPPYEAPCPGAYALEIEGESMNGEGAEWRFESGDCAVLCPTLVRAAKTRDLVHVEVQLDGEGGDQGRNAYLRQYLIGNGRAIFRALNPDYEDLVVQEGQYHIKGVVTGKLVEGAAALVFTDA